MANHSDSISHASTGRGLLDVSAKWLASQGRLMATGLSNQSAQERTLECLAALGVGLEVWDTEGRPLFSNRMNATLLEYGSPLANTTQLIDVEQDLDGAWRPLPGNDQLSDTPPLEGLIANVDGASPHLQQLPGNRWIQVYGARSTMGYVAVARVEVTDMVRRGQDLEDRIRQLTRDSATDGLTGLANRRHFDMVFSAEWNRAARSQTPISLLMVDIDHFKNYNDHYGHHAGDLCLKKVAAVMEGCVRRAGELVARYGGEEFVLLLPGSDMTEACETAQKCLDRLSEAALPHAAAPECKSVTLSIGVASIQPHSALEPLALLKAADSAMYRAKSGGRARYEVAVESDWTISDDTPRTRPGLL